MVQLLWFKSCRAWYGDYFIIMVRYFKSYCHYLWICARGWYIQLKGHHMGLQNSMVLFTLVWKLWDLIWIPYFIMIDRYFKSYCHFICRLTTTSRILAHVPNSGQFQKRPDFCPKFSEIPIFVPNFQKIPILSPKRCLTLQIILLFLII